MQDARVLPIGLGSADGGTSSGLDGPGVVPRCDAAVGTDGSVESALLARSPAGFGRWGVADGAAVCGAVYRRATGRTGGKTGAITVIQRFGSALNPNLPYHIVRLDGVWDRCADGALRFFQGTPTTAEIEELVVEITLSGKPRRWLEKQGFGGSGKDTLEGEDGAQAVLRQASLLGTVALGDRAGHAVRRVQRLGDKEFALPPRCSAATTSMRTASERDGLERLCSYVLRPPLAVARLERLEDGRPTVFVLVAQRPRADACA